MTLHALRVRPPDLSSPITVHVEGDYKGIDGSNSAVRVVNYPRGNAYLGTDINAGGRDVVLACDGPVKTALRVHNARHVYSSGLEVDVDRPWVDPAGWTTGTMPYNNATDPHGWLNGPRNCLQVYDITGVAYFEGAYLHGVYAIDAFKLARINHFVAQAFRGEVAKSGNPGSSAPVPAGSNNWQSGSGGFHNDVVQFYDWVNEVDLDWATGITGFQGIMYLISNSASGGKWLTSRMSRMNLASAHAKGLNGGDSLRSGLYSGAINHVPPSYNPGAATIKGPFYYDDVWIDPDPALFADLKAAMGLPYADSTNDGTPDSVPSAYQGQTVKDVETGLQRILWQNWPVTGGDPSGQLYPGTSFYKATDSRFIRQGPPRPTTAHPENPTGDYGLAADLGVNYVSPGYEGVIPPNPPPVPAPTGRDARRNRVRHGVLPR